MVVFWVSVKIGMFHLALELGVGCLSVLTDATNVESYSNSNNTFMLVLLTPAQHRCIRSGRNTPRCASSPILSQYYRPSKVTL